MSIDWSKPLELADGTPVEARDPDILWPDDDGDYWAVRSDGEAFEAEQVGLWLSGDTRVILRGDGRHWLALDTEAVLVRNRD